MRLALPLFAVMTALLSGCIMQAGPAHHLTDSEWRFITIDGEKATSTDALLSFGDGQLSGTVGCNRLSGEWRVAEGRLIAGPFAQTRMLCTGPVWDQEQAASALLVAAPELTLDGDVLVLRSSGHEAQLQRVEPPAPAQ